MKISEQKKTELYRAISNPITELRIYDKQGQILDMDKAHFDLEQAIWKRVKQVLNIAD